jgi:membrane fusion protein, adhesin transport system
MASTTTTTKTAKPAQPGAHPYSPGPVSPFLPAIEFVGSAQNARVLAQILAVLILTTMVGLIFTPWQQSVSGNGSVSALTPVERTQAISTPVEGRVLQWHVTEGSKVEKGDLIVEIQDNDPNILSRIQSELQLLQERRNNTLGRVTALTDRIARLTESRDNAVAAARSRVQVTMDRVRQAEQSITAAKERLKFATFNLDLRQKTFDRGLSALRDLEAARQEFNTAEAMVIQSEAMLSAAQNEKIAVEDDLRRIQADTQGAIEAERANLNLARAEVANIGAELQRTDVRLARQATQRVTAPRSGTILRLMAQPDSEVLKAGDAVAMFVPDAYTPTVEIWLDGVDMPLVHPGDSVRLMFNGWPAIQFVGWPSVAVGTFGGRVQLVDATDTRAGRFRILVVPDPDDDPWPSANYLRQGVQAKAWVLLRIVPLGWELWRRFNGFPPIIAEDEPGIIKAKERAGK